ncbi:MAG: hypothetical protein WB760_35355 [Xanthobacteraceae bacterium]
MPEITYEYASGGRVHSLPIKRPKTNSRLIPAASKIPERRNANQITYFFNAIGHQLPRRFVVVVAAAPST